MNKPAAAHGAPLVRRPLQGVEHEAGARGPARSPTDDPPGGGVDDEDEDDVDEAGRGSHI
jgi:hypothetical protein